LRSIVSVLSCVTACWFCCSVVTATLFDFIIMCSVFSVCSWFDEAQVPTEAKCTAHFSNKSAVFADC